MSPEEYFIEIINIEPIYECENQFFEPFWNFKYRIQSLQRHWELNKTFINHHLMMLNNVEGDSSAEFNDVYSETVRIDFDYFPEYLRLSTTSFALSLIENLLESLSQEVASDLGKEIQLSERGMPYINKYILWLTRSCGLNIEIDKSLWKSLDAIREMRNRFIHNIDRDIPQEIINAINEMVSGTVDECNLITDNFVNVSLFKMGNLVKIIELAYIDFYNNINNQSFRTQK